MTGSHCVMVSGSDEEAAKQAELESELRALDSYLSQPGHGPLLGGQTLSMADASIAPKLYHARVALKHFKQYSFPAELAALERYNTAVTSLPAWKAVDYGVDAIIAGWKAHGVPH